MRGQIPTIFVCHDLNEPKNKPLVYLIIILGFKNRELGKLRFIKMQILDFIES